MANTISKNQIITGCGALILMLAAGLVGNGLAPPAIKVSKQESAINFNTDLVKIFSMGQKRVLADSIWITTLLESDVEHYKGDDLNSWIYLRFKTLFALDPKFLAGYRFAGKYLSIVKDDLEGAKEIFEQGLSHYPLDYQLNLDAGFLYGFEMGEFELAKKRYEIALQYPQAPDFLRSIIIKFDYESTQNRELTFKLLSETYKTLADGSHIKEKMKKDLYSLKAEIDLDCLNSGQTNCDQLDYLGNRYIKNEKGYSSKYPFKKYKLFRKN